MMRIVIIEDNPADVLLFREALNYNNLKAEIIHFPDGVAAAASLEEEHEGWKPPPHMVFLDLNMPRLGGFEVLRILRNIPQLESVPVAVFTSSQAPSDMEEANALRANRFIRKPADLLAFFAVINSTVRELA